MNVEPKPVDYIKKTIQDTLAPVPLSVRGEVERSKELMQAKILAVMELMKENPTWKPDGETLGRILESSKGLTDKKVRMFTRELEVNHCSTKVAGIIKVPNDRIIPDGDMAPIIRDFNQGGGVLKDNKLSIQESALQKLDKEQFWAFIKESDVETVVIQREDGSRITYPEGFLKKVAEKGPSLDALTDEWSVTFDSGDVLKRTKAILQLLGPKCEAMLKSSFIESKTKTLAIEEFTLNGFVGLLRMVETGKLDPDIDVDEYKKIADYFVFDKPVVDLNQEGIYGQAAWDLIGDVGKVPPLSRESQKAWEGPCPIFNKENKADGPKMKDTHLAFYFPETINGQPPTINYIEKLFNSDAFGPNKIKYEYIWDEIRKQIGDQPIKGGYWFTMPKAPLAGTENLNYPKQMEVVKATCPKEYDAPSPIEAILYCFMPYIASGEKKKCMLGRTPRWQVTRCNVKVGNQQVAVGALAPSGLYVNLSDDSDHVCVVPSRKF